jgi:hypothetical protein
MFGMRMYLGQGKIAKDESQSIAQFTANFIDDRICHAAIWALIVTIFDQRNRGAGGSADVITLADG